MFTPRSMSALDTHTRVLHLVTADTVFHTCSVDQSSTALWTVGRAGSAGPAFNGIIRKTQTQPAHVYHCRWQMENHRTSRAWRLCRGVQRYAWVLNAHRSAAPHPSPSCQLAKQRGGRRQSGMKPAAITAPWQHLNVQHTNQYRRAVKQSIRSSHLRHNSTACLWGAVRCVCSRIFSLFSL